MGEGCGHDSSLLLGVSGAWLLWFSLRTCASLSEVVLFLLFIFDILLILEMSGWLSFEISLIFIEEKVT